jgi:hypothetical protein
MNAGRINLNQMLSNMDCSARSDLRRMVVPLANYICATDQPRQVMLSALSVLFREVEATNRAATTHFHSHEGN